MKDPLVYCNNPSGRSLEDRYFFEQRYQGMDATGISTVGNKTFEDHKDDFVIEHSSTEAHFANTSMI